MPDYPSPIATVDVVLLTVVQGQLCVRLMRRTTKDRPFYGRLALIGGWMHVGPEEDKNTEDTAWRVLREKVGLKPAYLEQLCTVSGADRDPDGWSLSVVYYALLPQEMLMTGKPDEEVILLPVSDLPDLAFDHNEIVQKAVRRVQGKSTYSSLPLFLLPDEFTFAALQEIYALVLGKEIAAAHSFRRKIEAQGIIEPISGRLVQGVGRPAQLYRKSAGALAEFDRTI